MNTLSAKNLTKIYSGRKVVNDISITVNQSIVGILGPNGAGKTSTFYMMVGLTRPDSGSISLNGKVITNTPLHKRAKLGISYLPQEPSIFQQLTVAENILAVLELNPKLTKKMRLDRTEALLSEFSISSIRNSKGISLSGGERRRVEIARALSTDPSFILLDEPFAGIDPLSVADIKEAIRQLQKKGIGVLITDHNVRETLDICEKAYIFNIGKVIASGTPEEILANQAVRTAYLGEQFTLDRPQATTNKENE